MILLVDCGNTRTKFAKLVNGNLSNVESIANQDITAPWFSEHTLCVTKVVVASVANTQLVESLKHFADEQAIAFVEVKTQQKTADVINGYENYQQLGVDRWLAVVGAQYSFPKTHLIIVDAGTATTVDILLADKRHVGGWILPGITMLHDSILLNTSQVKSEFSHQAQLKFGRTSAENVNNASWAATAGMIKEAHRLLHEQLSVDNAAIEYPIKTVITGGNGKKLSSLLPGDCELVENLVFKGMTRFLK